MMSMLGAAPTLPPPDLPERLAFVIAGLCRMVAAHIATDRTAGPWIVAVWQRFNTIAHRIARLSAQIRAGTVPPLRAGFKLTKPRKPPTRPAIVLPKQSFWLGRVIQPTAVYGSFLRQLLDDPQMAEMLKAAPQLARILRPLCRALGVEPPPLPPRPALRASAPAGSALPTAAQPDAPSAPASPRRRPRARPVFVWPAPLPATLQQKPA